MNEIDQELNALQSELDAQMQQLNAEVQASLLGGVSSNDQAALQEDRQQDWQEGEDDYIRQMRSRLPMSSLYVDYRIAGNKKVLKEIYGKCKFLEKLAPQTDLLPSLARLLDLLGIHYDEMPPTECWIIKYSDGELLIRAIENDYAPSEFCECLCRYYDDLTVSYWCDKEEVGFFANDKNRLVRLVDKDKIVSNDEALDYVNRELQKSDTFKDLHFDTIEDLKEWYEENEDEASYVAELQIAEYKSYEDWRE